jgi:D-beta-D-heptose 7-phosphate kinase/D-beta-D-heptose 1-phosphate adenosyltransferase
LLGFARSHGDLLVVGLNSDASVRQLKGPARPVYCESDRARLLAALELVDYVVLFSQTRADDLIRLVRPDVLVKGADWNGRRLDGGEFVESYGGRVMLAPLLPDHSTTLALARIRAAEESEVAAS